MKDWSIILVRNEYGTWIQRIYWSLIRLFTSAEYNHCQLVRDLNGELYICESDVSGFRITKTLAKWRDEQFKLGRIYRVLNLPGYSHERFTELLGNRYDVGYWTYLTRKKSSNQSTNCFQSLAYIFGFNKHWLATANTFFKK
jgi:hypothetical protein